MAGWPADPGAASAQGAQCITAVQTCGLASMPTLHAALQPRHLPDGTPQASHLHHPSQSCNARCPEVSSERGDYPPLGHLVCRAQQKTPAADPDEEVPAQARAVIRVKIRDGPELLLCLVKWMEVIEDDHHEPTGMALFTWEMSEEGRAVFEVIPADTVKCPIVLQEHLSQPEVFIYNHFLD